MSAFVPSGTDPTGSSVLAAITRYALRAPRRDPLTPDEKLVAVDGRLRAHRRSPCIPYVMPRDQTTRCSLLPQCPRGVIPITPENALTTRIRRCVAHYRKTMVNNAG